jgi:PKD repeat protein
MIFLTTACACCYKLSYSAFSAQVSHEGQTGDVTVNRNPLRRLALAVLPVALCLVAAGQPGSGDSAGALEATYAAARHLPPGSVGGVRAGSLHTATADGVNWAIADFTPAASDPANVQAAFQDGASAAVFRQAPGQAWHLVSAGPYGCGRGLPTPLVQSFGLGNPAVCRANVAAERGAAARAPAPKGGIGDSIASIALTQVGVGVTPPVPDFASVDCDPYSTLVGAQSPNADGCGLNSNFRIQNQNEAWCSDFAKWVWQRAGVTADMNTINAGSVSFYDWGLQQKETMPPGSGTPAVGDAVVFFPPGPITATTYADHVGIVTGINVDGTINMVNGDFAGGPEISVQYDTSISLTSWASQVWNQGEQWVLVTPPAGPQQPAPVAAAAGPTHAVAGTSVSFSARASGATQYLWTFGDGRADNVSGANVSHVYAENGVYPVTMSVTSSLGTVTTRTWDVDVTGPSSAAASVPFNAVWYSPLPVGKYVFLRSPSGLAAETWDGASWLRLAVPGTPDSGSGLTALSYPDQAVNDAMTPHAYYTSGGTLAETYLGSAGWTTQTLAGQPAAGSAIAADSGAAGPAVFYFGAGRRLFESSEQDGNWVTSAVGGPATASLGSLALADTGAGPVLFYLSENGSLTVAGPARATQIKTPMGVAPDSPLAAVSTSPYSARGVWGDGVPPEVTVYFVDRHGALAQAVRSALGWLVSEVPGGPAAGPASALAATSYLLGAQSIVGAPAGVGTELFSLSASGQPSVTYSGSGGSSRRWRTVALPGTGTGILAADAYQNAGEPSRLYLSGPVSVDTASTPGGPWTSAALPATPATLADSVVLYAATAGDYASALPAAAAAGLPASQVTKSFATAWADTLSGNYLVIAVGLAATDALYFNVCGWANPSGEIAGSTPFYIAGGPLNSRPGPDAYEEAAAAASSQTPALAADLAYYATHGTLPPGVTSLPSGARPVYACSGDPS